MPLFLYGKSLGGLLSFNMTIKHPGLFSGITMVAPFFQHITDTLDKYKYVFKLFNLVQFYTSFSMRNTSRPGWKEYFAKYAYHFNDPKLIHMTKLSTIVFMLDQQEFARENLKKQRTPFLLVNAGQDTVVRNTTSEEVMKKVGNSQNKKVVVPDADHTTISIEVDKSMKVIREVIAYFDSIVQNNTN